MGVLPSSSFRKPVDNEASFLSAALYRRKDKWHDVNVKELKGVRMSGSGRLVLEMHALKRLHLAVHEQG